METGTTTLASRGSDERFPRNTRWSATVSGDGNLIAFVTSGLDIAPEDVCACLKVVLYDVAAGTSTTVSKNSDGEPIDPPEAYSLDPAISADGSAIAFTSYVSNFVRQTVLASGSWTGGSAHGTAGVPAISGDGSIVAYNSSAVDIVQDMPSRDPYGISWIYAYRNF